jgi:hypothetical protein
MDMTKKGGTVGVMDGYGVALFNKTLAIDHSKT